MSEPQTTRPRQVTLAAALIMGGSLFVVISVFEQMAGISSLRTREAVEEFLGDPPAAGMDLGVQGVLDMLRVLAMVAGGCATATGILGFQVLHRSRVARVALSALAVPLFLTGLVAGGFMSSLVAVAIVMLWLQPARDWFAGIDRPEPRQAAERSAQERDDVADGDLGAERPHLGGLLGVDRLDQVLVGDALRPEGERLLVQKHWERAVQHPIPDGIGGHGGGDAILLKDVFRRHLRVSGDALGRPAGYLDGLRAVAVGIAANQSLVTGLPVTIADLDLGADLSPESAR